MRGGLKLLLSCLLLPLCRRCAPLIPPVSILFLVTSSVMPSLHRPCLALPVLVRRRHSLSFASSMPLTNPHCRRHHRHWATTPISSRSPPDVFHRIRCGPENDIFQIAPKSFLSILIYSIGCQYDSFVYFFLKKIDWNLPGRQVKVKNVGSGWNSPWFLLGS